MNHHYSGPGNEDAKHPPGKALHPDNTCVRNLYYWVTEALRQRNAIHHHRNADRMSLKRRPVPQPPLHISRSGSSYQPGEQPATTRLWYKYQPPGSQGPIVPHPVTHCVRDKFLSSNEKMVRSLATRRCHISLTSRYRWLKKTPPHRPG